MAGPLYIAVDLGAGSGRVFLAGLDPGEFLLEETHRFQYPPSMEDGHERWDFPLIFGEVKFGLDKAAFRASNLDRRVQSLGIDSWGVDYGLLDADGNLIANPVCYRDRRTQGVMERVVAVVSRSEIFEKTGIQFQAFNTIYQLYSEGDVAGAATLLLLPDLINFFLTGNATSEYTNATTTQMLNAATGDWDLELLEKLKLPAALLRNVVTAGTDLGTMKSEIEDELGLRGIRVIAPATHDTASAVAGTPLEPATAYISSGTWSLIGIEREKPLINPAAERENFTNEGGAYGTIRFLKNVMGLWIFESCRREWKAGGTDVDYDVILNAVFAAKEFSGFIFPDDERFLNPPSMIAAIREQLTETGQEFDESPSAVAKVIFDSLAFRYASVLRTIESLTEQSLSSIQIVGGGGRNRYLNQMTANASALKGRAGLTEATVVGNALVQAISAGRFESLAAARRHVLENMVFEEFTPILSAELDDAARRYAEVEGQFMKLSR